MQNWQAESVVHVVVACLPRVWGHVHWHQQTWLPEQADSAPVCLIVPSSHCIVNCILKKKKLPLALSCQGVIFLGAYNWLIPKKVLSAIRTSSAPQKAYALDFEVCNRCKLSITYLKKKFHSFLPHSYKERHQGKFLQLPLPWVMRILWTLS